MKKLKVIFFCLFGLILLSFKADETPIERLLKQLVKLTENYPQEKIHLHFDKPYYAIGEDIMKYNHKTENEVSFSPKIKSVKNHVFGILRRKVYTYVIK